MGRIIISLILLALISCNHSPEEGIIENRDSLQLQVIKRAYKLQRKLDSLEHATKDSVLLEKISYYQDLNNANITGTINYKRAVLRSYYYEDEYSRLEKEVEVLTVEVKKYQTKYEESIRTEEETRHKLVSEIERHKATRVYRDKLQHDIDEASVLKPIGIIVEPMGKNLWGKPTKTYIAPKVTSVNFHFVLPENKLTTRETKDILIVMLSSDGRDSIKRNTQIDYVGNQVAHKMILSGKSFTPGPHQITFYINGELQYKTTVDLLSR